MNTIDSQPERQRVPQNPIQRYATYLKGVYDSAIVSSDKFPNLMCSEFINLALVKSDRVSSLEADEFTKATLHGHIDEILQKKEPIKLEEVLKPGEGQQRMKCVYIQGAPGVGKSTCVGELCRRWDTHEKDALKEYSLVILLRLREKRVQEARNVKDLCYHDNIEVQQGVAAEIEACEGKDVLFILDGFDELPTSLQKCSVFIKLIQGTYLSHCTVLVTSRPSATADLLSVARPQIHKQIEVIGFTQAHIEQYAKAFFISQPDVLADFLTYISTHPAIRSLMYIPLNSAITAETYRHNRTVNRPIPQTMTQLYIEMSLTLLQRHLGEDDPFAEQLPERLEDLPPQLHELFSSLAKLAFEGLERNEVIFHKLPNSFIHFGFMNSPTELYMGRKASISHSFLHLTLQEFLAAFHISQLSPSGQQSVFEKCGTAGWDVVWRFVAGLTGFHGMGWEVVKSKKGRCYDERLKPFLIQCLYEAQEKTDCDSVLGESEVSLRGRDLTAFDCYAVGYCVTNSKCMWKLNMHGNESLGGTLVEMLKHGLRSPIKNPPQKELANILLLKLKRCGLTSTAFDQFADIIPLMINLKELDISRNPAGDGGLVKLLRALSHLKHLQTLDMSDANIGCADIEALSCLISPSSSLKQLVIGDEDMSSETTEVMLKTVLSPSSLEYVGLNWTGQAVTLLEENNLTLLGLCVCGLNSTAFDQLADIIPLMINLKALVIISRNAAGDGGLVKLLHALFHLKHLQRLDVSDANIGCADVEALSCLISPSSSLKELAFGGKDMSSETTAVMLKTVFSPSSLESVLFTEVNWTDQAVTLLEENNNLTTLLILSSTPGLFSSVAMALCKNSHLKDLYCYYHEDAAASSLVELLRTNQTLETLKLRTFTTGDPLISHISAALQFNHTLKTFEIRAPLQSKLDRGSLDPRITYF